MPRGYASGVIISQPGQTREHARLTPRTESGMYKPPLVGADWTWNPPIIGADGAVLFFRLRQLPASSRPLLSDRDSSAEIAPCSASESSDASELILETSLAAAVRVRNAALCSPVLLTPPCWYKLICIRARLSCTNNMMIENDLVVTTSTWYKICTKGVGGFHLSLLLQASFSPREILVSRKTWFLRGSCPPLTTWPRCLFSPPKSVCSVKTQISKTCFTK